MKKIIFLYFVLYSSAFAQSHNLDELQEKILDVLVSDNPENSGVKEIFSSRWLVKRGDRRQKGILRSLFHPFDYNWSDDYAIAGLVSSLSNKEQEIVKEGQRFREQFVIETLEDILELNLSKSVSDFKSIRSLLNKDFSKIQMDLTQIKDDVARRESLEEFQQVYSYSPDLQIYDDQQKFKRIYHRKLMTDKVNAKPVPNLVKKKMMLESLLRKQLENITIRNEEFFKNKHWRIVDKTVFEKSSKKNFSKSELKELSDIDFKEIRGKVIGENLDELVLIIDDVEYALMTQKPYVNVLDRMQGNLKRKSKIRKLLSSSNSFWSLVSEEDFKRVKENNLAIYDIEHFKWGELEGEMPEIRGEGKKNKDIVIEINGKRYIPVTSKLEKESPRLFNSMFKRANFDTLNESDLLAVYANSNNLDSIHFNEDTLKLGVESLFYFENLKNKRDLLHEIKNQFDEVSLRDLFDKAKEKFSISNKKSTLNKAISRKLEPLTSGEYSWMYGTLKKLDGGENLSTKFREVINDIKWWGFGKSENHWVQRTGMLSDRKLINIKYAKFLSKRILPAMRGTASLAKGVFRGLAYLGLLGYFTFRVSVGSISAPDFMKSMPGASDYTTELNLDGDFLDKPGNYDWGNENNGKGKKLFSITRTSGDLEFNPTFLVNRPQEYFEKGSIENIDSLAQAEKSSEISMHLRHVNVQDKFISIPSPMDGVVSSIMVRNYDGKRIGDKLILNTDYSLIMAPGGDGYAIKLKERVKKKLSIDVSFKKRKADLLKTLGNPYAKSKKGNVLEMRGYEAELFEETIDELRSGGFKLIAEKIDGLVKESKQSGKDISPTQIAEIITSNSDYTKKSTGINFSLYGAFTKNSFDDYSFLVNDEGRMVGQCSGGNIIFKEIYDDINSKNVALDSISNIRVATGFQIDPKADGVYSTNAHAVGEVIENTIEGESRVMGLVDATPGNLLEEGENIPGHKKIKYRSDSSFYEEKKKIKIQKQEQVSGNGKGDLAISSEKEKFKQQLKDVKSKIINDLKVKKIPLSELKTTGDNSRPLKQVLSFIDNLNSMLTDEYNLMKEDLSNKKMRIKVIKDQFYNMAKKASYDKNISRKYPELSNPEVIKVFMEAFNTITEDMNTFETKYLKGLDCSIHFEARN